MCQKDFFSLKIQQRLDHFLDSVHIGHENLIMGKPLYDVWAGGLGKVLKERNQSYHR